MSPSASASSPGSTPSTGSVPGRDRVVHRHELLPVGEHRLDLERPDQRGDARQHVVRRQELAAELHQLGDARAVARALADLVGDERPRLWVVEPQTARAPPPRELGREEKEEPVGLLRAQMHLQGLPLSWGEVLDHGTHPRAGGSGPLGDAGHRGVTVRPGVVFTLHAP